LTVKGGEKDEKQKFNHYLVFLILLSVSAVSAADNSNSGSILSAPDGTGQTFVIWM